jgi:hypothetical protein
VSPNPTRTVATRIGATARRLGKHKDEGDASQTAEQVENDTVSNLVTPGTPKEKKDKKKKKGKSSEGGEAERNRHGH